MKAELELTSVGVSSKVVIDGMDVADALRSLKLTAGRNQITGLELDLLLIQGARVEADVIVELSADNQETLRHLGWTPPEEPAAAPAPG